MTTSRNQRRDTLTAEDLTVLRELQAHDPSYCSLFTSYLLQARSSLETYQRICLQLSNFGPVAYRDRLKSFALDAEAPRFLTLLPEALTRIQHPFDVDSYDDKTLFRRPDDRWVD